MARRRSNSSSLAFRVVASVVTAVALLAVGEGLARRVEPLVPQWREASSAGLTMVAHPTRLWALAPGTVQNGPNVATITENGLRDPCPAPAATPEASRVLVLGDSSFFGHALADDAAPPVQLAAALNARSIPAVGLNGAVPGYSTAQSRVLLDELGWSLEPDLLVVGNLWSDNSFDAFEDESLLRTSALFAANPLSRSALFRVVAAAVANARGDGPRVVRYTRGSSWPRDQVRRVALADYAHNLDAIVREARRRNVGVVFVAPANRELASGPAAKKLYAWDVYFDAQRAVAAWHGVPLVSAAEALRASGLSSEDAFVDVMHPSAAGVRVIAEAVAATVAAAGWPGERLLGREEPFAGGELVDPSPATVTGQAASLSTQGHLFGSTDAGSAPSRTLVARGTVSGGFPPFRVTVVDGTRTTWASTELAGPGPFSLPCPGNLGVVELVFTDAAGHVAHRPLDPQALVFDVDLGD